MQTGDFGNEKIFKFKINVQLYFAVTQPSVGAGSSTTQGLCHIWYLLSYALLKLTFPFAILLGAKLVFDVRGVSQCTPFVNEELSLNCVEVKIGSPRYHF